MVREISAVCGNDPSIVDLLKFLDITQLCELGAQVAEKVRGEKEQVGSPVPLVQNMADYMSNHVLEEGPFAGGSFDGEPLTEREYRGMLNDTSEDRLYSFRLEGKKGEDFM